MRTYIKQNRGSVMMKSVRVQFSAAPSAVRKEFGVFQRAYAPYAPLLLLLFSSFPLLSSIHPRAALPPLSAAPLIHPLGQSPSFDGEQKKQGGGIRKP